MSYPEARREKKTCELKASPACRTLKPARQVKATSRLIRLQPPVKITPRLLKSKPRLPVLHKTETLSVLPSFQLLKPVPLQRVAAKAPSKSISTETQHQVTQSQSIPSDNSLASNPSTLSQPSSDEFQMRRPSRTKIQKPSRANVISIPFSTS